MFTSFDLCWYSMDTTLHWYVWVCLAYRVGRVCDETCKTLSQNIVQFSLNHAYVNYRSHKVCKHTIFFSEGEIPTWPIPFTVRSNHSLPRASFLYSLPVVPPLHNHRRWLCGISAKPSVVCVPKNSKAGSVGAYWISDGLSPEMSLWVSDMWCKQLWCA